MRTQPPEVAAYLQQVERLLAPLPPDQRRHVVEDCAQHLDDAVGEGRTPQEAIALLGTPQEVAERAFQEHQEQTGVDPRPRYLTRSRVWQLVGAAAALAAGLVALLLPGYVLVMTGSDGEPAVSVLSLLEHGGLVAVGTVAVPVVLAASPLAVRGRAWWAVSVASVALLGVVVLLGSLTIGWFFLPALVADVVALVLARRAQSRQVT